MESGVMPRRPNQVVLPEPGRPMASTTNPLGAWGDSGPGASLGFAGISG